MLSEGQEAWDLEEEKDLVWSHATMQLSELEARGGQINSMVGGETCNLHKMTELL